DQVRAALAAPSGLVLASPVLQIQHWIALTGVLVVIGGCVDVAAAGGPGALGEIQGLAQLPVWDVLDGVEVRVLGGDLNSAAPSVGAEEELAARVRDVGTVDVDPVVVEALVQRAGSANPGAVLALRQCDPTPLGDPYALRIRRDDAESSAALGVYLRILLAGLIGRRRLEVFHRRRLQG